MKVNLDDVSITHLANTAAVVRDALNSGDGSLRARELAQVVYGLLEEELDALVKIGAAEKFTDANGATRYRKLRALTEAETRQHLEAMDAREQEAFYGQDSSFVMSAYVAKKYIEIHAQESALWEGVYGL
jgi:hypothetical protein